MKRLQVLMEGKWKYVFCRNWKNINPIVTEDKNKALPANDDSYAYFTRHFPLRIFRYSK